MLSDAVEEMRTGKIKPDVVQQGPSVDLPVKARIPESYVSDLDVRLELYQRISKLALREEVASMHTELIDRFGPLPPQAVNLLYAVDMKVMAIAAGVESIGVEDRHMVVKMAPERQLDKAKLQSKFGAGVRVGASQIRLDLGALGARWRVVLKEVLEG
jgi:transcription-repair coupling factor (superfamily II helicase)